jgi:hypothetical protein
MARFFAFLVIELLRGIRVEASVALVPRGRPEVIADEVAIAARSLPSTAVLS